MIKSQYTTFRSAWQAFLSDLEICDETNKARADGRSAESAPVGREFFI
jgi:hypothetical protein